MVARFGPLCDGRLRVTWVVRTAETEFLETCQQRRSCARESLGDDGHGAGTLGKRLGRVELRPVPDLLWLMDEASAADERPLVKIGLSRVLR